jgi:hypothetical protein
MYLKLLVSIPKLFPKTINLKLAIRYDQHQLHSKHFQHVDPSTCVCKWTTFVITLLLEEWEDDFRTLEMGTWEFARILEILEFNFRGQNTSHWGVFYIIEKLSKSKVENGLAWAIWTSATQVMTKRKVKSQTSLTPDHYKSGIDLTPVRAGGVQNTVRKLSTRATSLLQTSSQSEVLIKSYDPAKWRESKPRQFRDSSLWVPGWKTIRM